MGFGRRVNTTSAPKKSWLWAKTTTTGNPGDIHLHCGNLGLVKFPHIQQHLITAETWGQSSFRTYNNILSLRKLGTSQVSVYVLADSNIIESFKIKLIMMAPLPPFLTLFLKFSMTKSWDWVFFPPSAPNPIPSVYATS